MRTTTKSKMFQITSGDFNEKNLLGPNMTMRSVSSTEKTARKPSSTKFQYCQSGMSVSMPMTTALAIMMPPTVIWKGTSCSLSAARSRQVISGTSSSTLCLGWLSFSILRRFMASWMDGWRVPVRLAAGSGEKGEAGEVGEVGEFGPAASVNRGLCRT